MGQGSAAEYELHAIRSATRPGRRAEMFVEGDLHDGPMPTDYFAWAARSPERTFVVAPPHDIDPGDQDFSREGTKRDLCVMKLAERPR